MTNIPLPWKAAPLTQNGLRRMHHHAEAKAKRAALAEARWAIRAERLELMPGAIVILHWQMPDRRRRDGDGAAPTLKVVLDALVAEGVLPDDSWIHVPHSGVTCHPPVKGQPGALWLELTDPDVAP
jgi:crossover junction endodeoxyribonuclease RusA